jgi:hypothetical protein
MAKQLCCTLLKLQLLIPSIDMQVSRSPIQPYWRLPPFLDHLILPTLH